MFNKEKHPMPKGSKRQGRTTSIKKKKVGALDKATIQRAVATTLLSLIPSNKSSKGKKPIIDPDVGYQLVLAAANQTIQQFDGVNLPPNMKPPTEMGVDVEYDPTLKKTETRYNFSSSKFTIYTPENLNDVISSGERTITKEESLRNALSEALPSAQFRLFFNQGVLLSNGNEVSYRDRYLPNQFRTKTKRKSGGSK
jgi:hypothetical protein